MIPTSRRIEYALGYARLGLLDEASDELAAVAPVDRLSWEVLGARIKIGLAANRWEDVADAARQLLAGDNANVDAWIALGCAVRRIESVEAARDLLLVIEPVHGGEHAVIHYNLACYHCVLGDIEEAKRRLSVACRMDGRFRSEALDDPDLEPMWSEIAGWAN